MAEIEEPTTCEACGRELPVQQGRGRRRRYCDATCRSAARRRRELAPTQPPLTVNENLTIHQRHENLDTVDAQQCSNEQGPADPVASRIRDTAGRPGAGTE